MLECKGWLVKRFIRKVFHTFSAKIIPGCCWGYYCLYSEACRGAYWWRVHLPTTKWLGEPGNRSLTGEHCMISGKHEVCRVLCVCRTRRQRRKRHALYGACRALLSNPTSLWVMLPVAEPTATLHASCLGSFSKCRSVCTDHAA